MSGMALTSLLFACSGHSPENPTPSRFEWPDKVLETNSDQTPHLALNPSFERTMPVAAYLGYYGGHSDETPISEGFGLKQSRQAHFLDRRRTEELQAQHRKEISKEQMAPWPPISPVPVGGGKVSAITSMSRVVGRFGMKKNASFGMDFFRRNARSGLLSSDAPNLSDLPPLTLGDEFGWGWTMLMKRKGNDASLWRAEYAWREKNLIVNVSIFGIEKLDAEIGPLALEFSSAFHRALVE